MKIYTKLDMCSLEINPFTIRDGIVYPLDLKVEVDEAASYMHKDSWGKFIDNTVFGRSSSETEEFIQKLDASTGASLKFILLNPKGRIWTLIAGGGSSVIFADAIVSAGYSDELANYGEYSGNPNKEHIELYSQTIIDLMCEDLDNLPKVLLIGGGIANFTDVKSTFLGIANAIQNAASKLQKTGVKIFVRRGGPNEKEGLMMLRDLGEKLDLSIEVYDRFTPMTQIVTKALEIIK
jgi:ATP citrate (pro-S)-lyase